MISIIIPAYNEEKFISATLDSIKSQDFKDYEIIVICNGCTDNTSNIAKKYTDKVFNLKQKNTSLARNYGVKKSKGDILIFLDADIRLVKNVLSEISKANGFGTCKGIPSNVTLKNTFFMMLKNFSNFLTKFFPNLCGSNGIIFIKKDLFKKINGFNEKIKKGEDRNLLVNAKKFSKYLILRSQVIISTRRYDKIGYLKIIFYWINEFFNPSDEEYVSIR